MEKFSAKKLLHFLMGIVVVALSGFMAINLLKVNAEESFDFANIETQCYQMTANDDLESESGFLLDNYIANMRNDYYKNGSDNYARIYEHDRHIRKIIPEELFFNLGSYQFVGDEYMFYVKTLNPATGGGYVSSVLIIDYDFTYESTSKLATTRLQMFQSDYQVILADDSSLVIFPIAGQYNKFYLYRPQIFGTINNSHNLNSFDSGYSKKTDEGMIFRQTRLNYSGVCKKVDKDIEFMELPFLVETAIQASAAIFDISPVVDILSFVVDGINAVADALESDLMPMEANNERNITDLYVKSEQVTNDEFEQLTKTVSARPQDNLLINDYIEMKVLLSEDLAPAKLAMGVHFQLYIDDITQQESPFPEVSDDFINIGFVKDIQQKIYNEEDFQRLYILPGDKQVFEFIPVLGGNYVFDVEKSADIKIYNSYDIALNIGEREVIKNSDNAVKLQTAQKYYIEVNNVSENILKAVLTYMVQTMPLTQGNIAVNLPSNSTFNYKITGDKENISINVENENISIEVYDENFDSITIYKYGTKYQFLKEIGSYYVIFRNETENVISTNIFVQIGTRVNLFEDTEVAFYGVSYYKFIPQVTAKYVLEASSEVAANILGVENKYDYWVLNKGEVYFIKLTSTAVNSATFRLEFFTEDVNFGESTVSNIKDELTILKFSESYKLAYTINTTANIQCFIQNGEILQINSNTAEVYLDTGELYIVVSQIQNEIVTINITTEYETIEIGYQKEVLLNEYGYKLLKFNVRDSAYYKAISENTSVLLLLGNESEFNNSVFLISGTYYFKVLGSVQNENVRVEITTQVIVPHQGYHINKKSYFKVAIDQNTEYVFETYGSNDYFTSTSISILTPDGQLLAESVFEKYGKLNYININYNYVNVIVDTTTTDTISFRVLYANEEDIPENTVSIINLYDESEIDNKYIQLNISQNVYLFIDKPYSNTDISIYKLNSDNSYVLVSSIKTTAEYEKYLFTISDNQSVLFIDGGETTKFEMTLLPQTMNAEIFIQDASGNAVENLLIGNTYSFSLRIDNQTLNSTKLKNIIRINGQIVSAATNYNFKNYKEEDSIEIEFFLYDYTFLQAEYSLENLFEIFGSFRYANISGAPAYDYHLEFSADIIDHGSDGTYDVSTISVSILNQAGNILFSGDTPGLSLVTSLANYHWETNMEARVAFFCNDDWGDAEQFVYSNEKILFKDADIKGANSQVFLYGDANIEINKIIEIPSNVQMINIEGLSDVNYQNLSFKVQQRITPILINMNNMNFTAGIADGFVGQPCFSGNKIECCILKCFGSNKLTGQTAYMTSETIYFGDSSLYIIGGNTDASLEVIGPNGRNGDSEGYAGSGSSGVFAKNMYIAIDKLIAKGGNGGNGAQGVKGSNANNYTSIGSAGGMGGDGGNGAPAIWGYVLTINVDIFEARGGHGGAGGKGGTGGNGARGYNSTVENGTGGKGSNGGTGGAGGAGGDGSAAVYAIGHAEIQIGENSKLIGGNAGDAGIGGTGGAGGAGGKGGPGQFGIFVNSCGGPGGQGGNGGNGGNGGLYGEIGFGLNVAYENIQREYCQNGSRISDAESTRGKGGVGGAGGAGGEPGKNFGVIGSVGAQGSAGVNGLPGNPGY